MKYGSVPHFVGARVLDFGLEAFQLNPHKWPSKHAPAGFYSRSTHRVSTRRLKWVDKCHLVEFHPQ